jgi:hypothetical protein
MTVPMRLHVHVTLLERGQAPRDGIVATLPGMDVRAMAADGHHLVIANSVADGRHLVIADSVPQAVVVDLASGATKSWPGVRLGQSIAISPDGTRVAFWSDGYATMDLATGAVRRGRAAAPEEFLTIAGWTASGVVAVTTNRAINLLDPASGAVLRGLAGGARPPDPVAVSPDGSRLALSDYSPDAGGPGDGDGGAVLNTVIGVTLRDGGVRTVAHQTLRSITPVTVMNSGTVAGISTGRFAGGAPLTSAVYVWKADATLRYVLGVDRALAVGIVSDDVTAIPLDRPEGCSLELIDMTSGEKLQVGFDRSFVPTPLLVVAQS